ncbi:MAG: carbohydrate binding family 9 domain-containing protein [candidate division WOR-3 bacterium]|nr:MAG: carbohydrate binding family 9 domain-containing protein [candidate division WOR-3 bacterium]
MIQLLCLLLVAAADKTVQVRHTDIAPRIDGVLEQVWNQADSIVDFIQSQPDEAAEPTEKTAVYVLQDRANLYVAYRCEARNHPPVGQLYGLEDEFTVFIDPMDTRQTGYFFKLYGSGIYRSGLILDDGRMTDWSWEGVWYSAIKLHEDSAIVEMKIPFKSIRYKRGAGEWGINFGRFIAYNRERDYWVEVTETGGGNRVSNFGRLKGMNPRSQGYYFELYPEGFVRLDQDPGEDARVRPSASLNLKWDLTSVTTLNATVLPDFAQIESDPFSFNLSRYPVYFPERRPFFIEGSELFRMTGIGGWGFRPLELFYSRRIGKAVGEEPVPILSGLKLTTRSPDWSFGALGAYTDRLTDSAGAGLEPRRGFAVLSGKFRLPDATSLGLLFSGTAAPGGDYNAALGADWNFRSGPHRGAVQTAVTADSGRTGWALNSGYSGYVGNFTASGALSVYGDSFSVEDIGYAPWAGMKSFEASAGPVWRGNGGALRRSSLTPGFEFAQIPGSDQLSCYAWIPVEFQFRNGWGMHGSAYGGKGYEADTSYFGRGADLSIWGNSLQHDHNVGVSFNHDYNYRRGYVADHFSDWFTLNYYLLKRVALTFSFNNWWECSPDRDVIGVTSVARPKVDFRIDAKMSFNVYSEMVLVTPETRFGETDLVANRIGFLFSWNFLPKSWLYVALNDYSVDTGEGCQLADRVAAVKLRYLVYF